MTQADQSANREARSIFSWPVVALILGLGLLVVVAIAIQARSSAFEIVVEGEGRRLVFDFDKEELNLSELLDRILSPHGAGDDEAESERRVVRAVLNQHSFYYVPSVEVAGAIRGIQETDETREFIKALRGMLYNLEGPFARPKTFAGAADDRIVLALDDLEPSNPLVARLWEMSLEWEGVFAPRSINLSVREDEVLKEGIAATCVGSVLLNKSGLMSPASRDRLIEVRMDASRPCTATASTKLLAGEAADVWLSPADMDELWAEQALPQDGEMEAILFPLPKNLTSTTE